MEKTAKKLDSQVQFWTLIGPLLVVLTLLAILIKGDSRQWLLSLSVISGIPLCWKWEKKGFILSLSLLAAIFAFQLSSVAIEERFWVIVLSSTIATVLLIISLSFEEAKDIIKGLEVESKSRLENLFQLDEKLKEAQLTFQKEREQCLFKVKHVQLETEEKQQQLSSLEQVLNTVRSEMLEVYANRDKLLKEVWENKNQLSFLEQKLGEVELQKVTIPQVTQEELTSVQTQLTRALEELNSARTRIEEYSFEIDSLKEINELQEKIALESHHELLANQAILRERNESVQDLSREKVFLEKTLSKLQVELETSSHLAQKRQEIIDKQNEEMLREKSEREALKNNFEEEMVTQNSLVDELTAKWTNLTQQLAETQNYLLDYQEIKEKCSLEQAHCATLLQEKEAIQRELEEKSNQLLILQQQDEKCVGEDKKAARAHAMYVQLREQFEEKSKVLHETRRELFQTQEKLQCLQKENDEINCYGMSDSEVGLHKMLTLMEKECAQQAINHEKEVQALHEVISSLLIP